MALSVTHFGIFIAIFALSVRHARAEVVLARKVVPVVVAEEVLP